MTDRRAEIEDSDPAAGICLGVSIGVLGWAIILVCLRALYLLVA